MWIAMVANEDPNAAGGEVAVLTIAAVVFATFAVRLYRPLFAARTAASLSQRNRRLSERRET
jgi:hypothetical protein